MANIINHGSTENSLSPVNSNNINYSELSDVQDSSYLLPSHAQCLDAVFSAAKSGSLIPVQNLFEQFGSEIFCVRDNRGNTPVHWACLGGHATVIRFVIEHKGHINLPSENDSGARPIHWACVNGHVAVVDILLQAGVSIDTCDNKGCTPLIVAAQYGQIMLCGYLMGRGACLQMVDKDGDNALHWAAFKGQSELIRLLIYSGFNPQQRDNYCQTPLHLACISGNLSCVKELCEQDSVDLNLIDKNGKTPLMLAFGRKHTTVVNYLKRETRFKNSIIPRIDFWTIVFGPPGKSKGPILFFILNLLCFGYPVYIFKVIPETHLDLQYLHVIFVILNVIMWVCLYRANTLDPGFLPQNTSEYDMAIKMVAHYDEWSKGHNPLSRLCHTCRAVKPLRSKHCRVCNRCVLHFDHHCPYINNCVGYYNRSWFLVFIICVALNCNIAVYFTVVLFHILTFDVAVFIGFIDMLFYGVVNSGIAIFSVYHVFINLTTNERINYKRYRYLHDDKGNYYNPFNRGWQLNFEEFFHMRQPLTEPETEHFTVV